VETLSKKCPNCRVGTAHHPPPTHTHARTHTHIRTHSHSLMHKYTHTHAHTHTHTHAHTHAHTHRVAARSKVGPPLSRAMSASRSSISTCAAGGEGRQQSLVFSVRAHPQEGSSEQSEVSAPPIEGRSLCRVQAPHAATAAARLSNAKPSPSPTPPCTLKARWRGGVAAHWQESAPRGGQPG